MKTSEMIQILSETLKENGDQDLVIMVNGKRYTDIEAYTDDEKELYLEGYIVEHSDTCLYNKGECIMEEKVIFRIEKDPYMPGVEKYLAIFPEDEANHGRVCAVPFYKKNGYWRFEPFGEISYSYMYMCKIIHKNNPLVPTLVAALEERYGGTYKVVEKIM